MIDPAHIASAAAALAAMRTERPAQLDDATAVKGWLLDHGVTARPLVRVIEETVRLGLAPTLSRLAADPGASAQARRTLLSEGYGEAAVDAAIAAWSRSKPVNAPDAVGSSESAWPAAPKVSPPAPIGLSLTQPHGARLASPAPAPAMHPVFGLRTWSMVPVPAGSFTMGSPEMQSNQPHEVTLSSPLEFGAYPVTQEVWASVINGENPSAFRGLFRPVERVSWLDALKFCDALSRLAGLTPCYGGEGDSHRVNWSADGYRLPTEAEWEYACRAATQGAGAGTLDQQAWFAGNSGSRTHDVGEKAANAWGLHDTLGNVWEWCWDVHAPGTPAGGLNPKATGPGTRRVLRGGSWCELEHYVRAARRESGTPTRRDNNLGFRVCRTSR
jgi:sulfatase modifying factor 1